MIVVSDTSPLTYLYQIGRFSLLTSLYEEVVIPPAVERELKQAGLVHEGLDWSVLRVVAPQSADMVASLGVSLDPGESEAIVVASEIHADLLLIDEASGREIARKMGIPLTGLLRPLLLEERRPYREREDARAAGRRSPLEERDQRAHQSPSLQRSETPGRHTFPQPRGARPLRGLRGLSRSGP